MSTSSYISHSAAPSGPGSSTSRDGNNNDNVNDSSMDGDNLLKLALKKPKAWKWELTTSSSSPSIAFPKIQLFDSRTGELMVQVDKPDCVVKSEEVMGRSDGLERSRSLQDRKGRDQRYRRSRSTCIREKVTTSSDYLSDVFAQLQNKGMGHKLATSVTQYRVEETEEDVQENGYGLQKSQSAREIHRSSSVEQKKKILRTPSTRSGSMLGRISECFKSSTEEEPPRQATPPPPPAPAPTIPEISVEEEPEPKPTTEENKNKIYKLVRSNVGTLIVREESFHTQRSLRRRRQQLQEQPSIPESEPQVDKRITISDIPDSSYNDTIREIDSLISKVMLSHNLQDVHESRPHQSRERPSTQQNGEAEPVRKRRARRSASAGSNASSYAGSSGSRRSRNSPLVTVPTGSSSSDEDLVAMAESRFGSLKRRGRAKYKRNSTDQVHEVYSGSAGAQVNGVSRQHETNVRRSSTTVSSSNSTTVEIEECESVSLGGFQEQRETVVHRSSEKSTSSTTSLSTLSPPSPAAERCGGASPNRWGTHRVETQTRDWERVQEVTVSDDSCEKKKVETKMDWLETRCEDVVTVEEPRPSQVEISNTKTINDKKENGTKSTVAEVSSKKNEDNTPTLLRKPSNEYPKDLDVTSLKPVTELNETRLRNGYEETNVTSRDQERSKPVENLKSYSQKLDKERPSVRFQPNLTKDCTESPTNDSLNVTARDVPRRSPTTTPKFGPFQFPRHIDGSNVSSASLAWSYLPQLSTSHSTSSLASLRSNSGSATTSSQSPVQRRQLKSYAQRHHRSSFHVVPN